MRTLLTHADWGGSSYYRLLFAAEVLQQQGADITTDYFGKSIYAETDKEMTVTHIRKLDFDVVVLHRPMTRTAAQAIPMLQAQGIAVVVELDDDFWSIRADNVFRPGVAPATNPNHNWQWLTECCKAADLVTVSTPALRKKIPNKNVRVLRNCVPSKYFEVSNVMGKAHDEVKGRLIVGWSGSLETHGGDLNACGTSIATAVRNAGARFMCVGSEEPATTLGFRDGETVFIPWVPFEEYPVAVDVFDIGIVPLKLYAFNASKSGLKGLEYSSLSIPFVASPTPEYLRLAKLGAGVIAERKHDWLSKLRLLLENPLYRRDMSESGLEVAKKNTYEEHSWKWLEAWNDAGEIRRAA